MKKILIASSAIVLAVGSFFAGKANSKMTAPVQAYFQTGGGAWFTVFTTETGTQLNTVGTAVLKVITSGGNHTLFTGMSTLNRTIKYK